MRRLLVVGGWLLVGGAATLAFGFGCDEEEEEGEGDDAEECGTCHTDVAGAWQDPSSHRLVLDCPICHAEVAEEEGPGHRSVPDCGTCHSERTHPYAIGCLFCHDPHGSPNAFLLRTSVVTPDGTRVGVRVVVPEGASAGGLVRAGVPGEDAGTGLCEVCHTTTAHYRNDGTGAPHDTAWCPLCHGHQDGFLPGR
jgi:hypothetical protein